MAFVVLLHLPLGRKSMLPEILARWTPMRVVEVIDGQRLEANSVYVPPPHAVVTVVGGHFRVQLPVVDDPRDPRPIDGFFDSLAADLREDAIGIVLSGTGSDGSLGLKAIKECGGLTIAQGSDGGRPEHQGMPAGAIATGVVDLVAPVEAIPAISCVSGAPISNRLRARHLRRLTMPRGLRSAKSCRRRLAMSFSGYRDKTFWRRVQRRMQVLNIDALEDYVVRLEHDHDEVVLLFRDLLIRVTSFFQRPAQRSRR